MSQTDRLRAAATLLLATSAAALGQTANADSTKLVCDTNLCKYTSSSGGFQCDRDSICIGTGKWRPLIEENPYSFAALVPASKGVSDWPIDEAALTKRYKLGKKLGSGVLGTTFEAVETATGMPVAIKVINDSKMADFAHEINMLKQATKYGCHPNIQCFVENFLASRADGTKGLLQPYIVTKLVRGKTLANYKTSLTEMQALRIARSLLSAVEFLNQNDISHNDIHTNNIVIRESDGEPVLIDFSGSGAKNLQSRDMDMLSNIIQDILNKDFNNPALTKVVDLLDNVRSETTLQKAITIIDEYSLPYFAQRPQSQIYDEPIRPWLQIDLEKEYKLKRLNQEKTQATNVDGNAVIITRFATPREAFAQNNIDSRLNRLENIHHPGLLQYLKHGVTKQGSFVYVTSAIPSEPTFAENYIYEEKMSQSHFIDSIKQMFDALATLHERDLEHGGKIDFDTVLLDPATKLPVLSGLNIAPSQNKNRKNKDIDSVVAFISRLAPFVEMENSSLVQDIYSLSRKQAPASQFVRLIRDSQVPPLVS